MRSVDSLTAEDFIVSPVWRFRHSTSSKVVEVAPVRRLPVKQATGCVVGCSLRLANRTLLSGFLGNLYTSNGRLTQHFLTVSVFRADGAVFHLARYHDFDAAERGPLALASFLALPLEAVFPIEYDVGNAIIGPAEILRGAIPAEPEERLSRAEVIALAVP
jgi:hypothetical protein